MRLPIPDRGLPDASPKLRSQATGSLNILSATAVIPVRKGSQRIPGKNLLEFVRSGTRNDGRPINLLDWKIQQLTQVLPPANVLVSSDWDEALSIAEGYGCLTHVRDASLATADAPFDQVIKSVADVINTEHMLWTPATSPFMGGTTLRRLLNAYLSLSSSEQANGAIGVHWVRNYCLFDGLPLNFALGAGHQRTQDILPIGIVAWAFSARPTWAVVRDSYMFSSEVSMFEISALEAFDINDHLDFKMAQSLIDLHLALGENSSA